MYCIVPWGVLAATFLVGDKAGVGEARGKARCKLGLLLCSVAVFALMGAGVDGLNLRGSIRYPEGIGFLPGVMAVFALVGGVASDQSLGAALLCFPTSHLWCAHLG